jgi:HK97 gp10 family phage protein
MIDFSDLLKFESRLNSTPDVGTAESWQDEWSNKVADEMRRNAPVATGTLKASIQVVSDGVAVTAPYAAFVEYGTSDTPPQPFTGPAVNRLIKPAAVDAGNRVLRSI